MQDQSQQKVASKDIIGSQAQSIDIEALEKNILKNFMSVTDDYAADTIHSAFVKVISKQGLSDEVTVTKAVFQTLLKGKIDKRPTKKRKNKIPHEVMQSEIMQSVS